MSRALGFVAALLFVPALSFAQQPCTTDARRVVNELYRHILERSSDDGSQHWVDQLNSRRMSVREVAHHIAASEEHARRFSNNKPHREVVATLYRHVLGRQPDEAGLNHWTTMAQQRGVNTVIEAFVNSEEYMGNFGDWGVPGSGGVRFCAPEGSTSAPVALPNTADNSMRFRGMDANRDGRITRNEWRGNARAFSNHDWNNDGVLSGDEIRPGAQSPDTADEFDRVTSADHRFDYLDVNGDGRIERNEWDGSDAVFNRVDRNRDGRLSRAEVGTSAPAFAAIDENNDGRISFDEWRWSRRAFERQDANDDGFITRREFDASAVPTTGR